MFLSSSRYVAAPSQVFISVRKKVPSTPYLNSFDSLQRVHMYCTSCDRRHVRYSSYTVLLVAQVVLSPLPFLYFVVFFMFAVVFAFCCRHCSIFLSSLFCFTLRFMLYLIACLPFQCSFICCFSPLLQGSKSTHKISISPFFFR